MRLMRALVRLVRGFMLLSTILTIGAIVEKVLGNISWALLGFWIAVNVGLLVLWLGLTYLGQRLHSRSRPRTASGPGATSTER